MQADYQSEGTMQMKKQSKPPSTFMYIEKSLSFDKPYEYFSVYSYLKLIIESDFKSAL